MGDGALEHVVDRIKRFVECIEPDEGDEGSITADEVFDMYFEEGACLRL